MFSDHIEYKIKIPDFIKKVLMIIMGLLLSFIIAEFLTRMLIPQSVGSLSFAYNKELGYIPAPDRHGQFILPGAFNYSYTNNSQGLRSDRNYSYEKTTPRILFLGDSFTYGVGVNDNETFSYWVQNYLENKVEVINAGNPGKGTDYALKFFQVMGRQLKPDVVAVMFFNNDFIDNGREEYFSINSNGNLEPKSIIKHKNFVNRLPGYDWLISWSQFINLIKKEIVVWMFPSSPSPKMSAASSTAAISYAQNDPAEYWRTITETYIKSLKDEVENSKAKLIFFYIPDKLDVEQYRSDNQYSNTEQSIADLLKSFNIAFFSLTPIIAENDNDISKLYLLDRHWTAFSHRLAAQYIFQHLVNLLPYNVKR